MIIEITPLIILVLFFMMVYILNGLAYKLYRMQKGKSQ